MKMMMADITLLNFVFCAAIVFLSITVYRKRKHRMPVYIGISFGLFGLSHLIAIIAQGVSFAGLLIIIRILAYLIVVLGLIMDIRTPQEF